LHIHTTSPPASSQHFQNLTRHKPGNRRKQAAAKPTETSDLKAVDGHNTAR